MLNYFDFKIEFMIKRTTYQPLENALFKGKAIIVFGARQVGKTSIIKNICQKYSYTWLNGDEPEVAQLLKNISTERLKLINGTHKILVIDEAQHIENIGLLIKRMVDAVPEIQIIASGSSAFELADKTKESMVGRKREFQLYPLSFQEMVNHHTFLKENSLLDNRLVYGYYPEVVTNPGNEIEVLSDLTDAFLFKDILNLEGVKKSKTLFKLVQTLAYRVGSEINYSSIATEIGISRITVEKYIDVLEKNFLIFTLPAFSRNLDNELKKGKKIYFWDNGIRNRVIKKFDTLENRDDKGALWENFLISERLKLLSYHHPLTDCYFWRNTQQAEIDFIEVNNTEINAYEFKYSATKKNNFSLSFTNTYKPTTCKVINKENYDNFLLYTNGK